jgi:hypothetical protein
MNPEKKKKSRQLASISGKSNMTGVGKKLEG